MSYPEFQTCSCGSPWWRLVDNEVEPGDFIPASVAFKKDGTIHAYSGGVECLECAAPRPMARRLRSVK
jgi:hypothetical protein